jgi:hypothetical protein
MVVGGRTHARRARATLVVAQIGLSVMLLAGAALLVRTLANLLAIDPGFRTEKILSAQIGLFGAIDSEAGRVEFMRRVADKMAGLPGVVSAAAVSNMPLHETPVDYRDAFSIEGVPVRPGDPQRRTLHTVATPNYFATMDVALLSGRLFDESDTMQTERVAVHGPACLARFKSAGIAPAAGISGSRRGASRWRG